MGASHIRLCGWIIAAALSGCTLTPPVAATRDAGELTDWQASGRIAVAGADTGGSGSFTWIQHGTQAQVHLRGPVGIGSVHLTLSDQVLRIDTADGQTFEADAAQAELTARLGALVPAQALRYWLVGIAAPGEHQWSTATATATDIVTLAQQDWRIDYQRYGVTSGVRVPLKLTAVNGPAKVRIVIDRWKIGR